MNLLDVLLAAGLGGSGGGGGGGADLSLLAASYSASQTYAAGDYCARSDKLWRCIVPIETPEAWTAAHWAEVTVGEELTKKLEGSGVYPELTAGKAQLAAQLEATVATEDRSAYSLRTAGGTLDIGDTLQLRKLVGGTVCWNQLIPAQSTSSQNGITATVYPDKRIWLSGTSTAGGNIFFFKNADNRILHAGHRYLIDFGELSGTGGAIRIYNATDNAVVINNPLHASYPRRQFLSPQEDFLATMYINFGSAGITISGTITPQLFDLTAMFGKEIADTVYAMEQATAGAGVAWFRRYFPKEYYAYDAGSLQSVRVSAHRTVGFNAFRLTGEDYGTAQVVGGMEYQIVGALDSDDVYLDSVAVVPDEQGYFTPTHSGELYVGSADETTCVHLVWDGERDGEFEAYEGHVYPLDASLELRGLFGIDASGNLTADGDEYAPDGTVTRKYAVREYFPGDEDEDAPDMITDGTHTVYKVAQTTTESASAYAEVQSVDDFGTEEFVDVGIAGGDRDVAIPAGHVTLYPPNLRAKLEMAPNAPAADGDYIVRKASGLNSYVPLPKELPALPSVDGTYTLKCTVTDGTATVSWVSDS